MWSVLTGQRTVSACTYYLQLLKQTNYSSPYSTRLQQDFPWAQIEKWVMEMSDVDFELKYEPGRDEADPLFFLSQHPLPETDI